MHMFVLPGRTRRQQQRLSKQKPAPAPVARIYLIRHGETDENRAGIIQGQMDTVLNEAGIDQAHLCGHSLRNVPFHAAFTSDLKRASKTAEIILSYQAEPVKLVNDEGLREREMGALQGVLAGSYDRTKTYEGSESGEMFAQRVLSWWQGKIPQILRSAQQHASGPVNILAVSHGAYLSTLIRVLLTGNIIVRPPTMRLDTRYYNTSITTIDMFATGKGILMKHGDISHLLAPKQAAATGSTTATASESAKNADAEVMQDR